VITQPATGLQDGIDEGDRRSISCHFTQIISLIEHIVFRQR
jgi:hypothetical protein